MSSIGRNRKAIKASAQDSTSRYKKKSTGSQLDRREQLYNECRKGSIKRVQVPEVMITSLSGILLDIDPLRFRRASVPPRSRLDPAKFYNRFMRKMLRRHPVLEKAEVRMSGTGLHIIMRFAKPVVFSSDSDRQRWAGIVKAIQRLLPTDPDCPGITAVTRPVRSINSKSNRKVQQLHQGEPVPVEEVITLFEELCISPFRTVASLLFGTAQIEPCPVCRADGSRLEVMDRVGKCYGGCGKVRLGNLYDIFLRPRLTKNQG